MAEKFYSILTNIGKAKIANSIGLGSKVNFVTMKVGDGGGTYYEPTEDQNDLKNTVWQGNINHVEIDENNPNWIHIEVMIPSDAGGFTIREYGAFDEEGNMLGICKCAETYKPVIADGSTKELLLNLILAVSNTESITLKIDPTIIFAKKSDVEQLRTDITAQLSDMAQDRIYYCGTTSGTNTYTATNDKITAYTEGLTVRVKIGTASTGGSTLNINGLGAKPILDSLGNAITSGGLKAGLPYQLCYNGTNFIVLGKGGGGNATADKVLSPYTVTTDAGQITGTIPSKGAQTYNPSTVNQTIPLGQYLSGNQVILGDSDLVSSNIISTANIFEIQGSATIESLGGRKFATNTVTATAGYNNFTYSNGSGYSTFSYYIIVSGLSFTPNLIILQCYDNFNYDYLTIYSSASQNPIKVASFNMSKGNNSTTSLALSSPAYVNSGGFLLPAYGGGTYTWYAIG